MPSSVTLCLTTQFSTGNLIRIIRQEGEGDPIYSGVQLGSGGRNVRDHKANQNPESGIHDGTQKMQSPTLGITVQAFGEKIIAVIEPILTTTYIQVGAGVILSPFKITAHLLQVFWSPKALFFSSVSPIFPNNEYRH